MSVSDIKAIPILEIADNMLNLVRDSKVKSGKDILYHGPNGNGRTGSLSISPPLNLFNDFSTGTSGDSINLVSYVLGIDNQEAIKQIAQRFNIKPDPPQTSSKKTLCQWIAEKALNNARNIEISSHENYLTQTRKISKITIKHAIQKGVLGYSDYTAPTKQPTQAGYGGNAIVFIIKDGHQTVAVDMRFLNPTDNGGIKTQCQGNKTGHYWTIDPYKLKKAKIVVIVESAINALTIDTCNIPHIASIAVMGVGNIDSIDWLKFKGKKIIIALDKDRPSPLGQLAGQEASWKLQQQLTNLGLASFLLDQTKWHNSGITDNDITNHINTSEIRKQEYRSLNTEDAGIYKGKIREILTNYGVDLNDILVKGKEKNIKSALGNIQDGLIQGVYYEEIKVKNKLPIPYADWNSYKKYRTYPQHTIFLKTTTKINELGEEQIETIEVDVCGFRIEGIKKIEVISYTSAITGLPDTQPNDIYAALVQTRLSDTQLIEQVLPKGIHNLQTWEAAFGSILNPTLFKRALTILESTARNNTIRVSNLVGLTWLDGKLVANDKANCFFIAPEKQCASYYNLVFKSGKITDCPHILNKYKELYHNNSALLMLIWSLSTHLKLFTSYYPHMMIGADKGAGKSVIMELIGKTCPLQKYSINELNSYRIRIATSGTSFPVAFDEFSNAPINKRLEVVSMMQNLYTSTSTVAGSDAIEYFTMSPILIGSEDTSGLDNVLSKTVKVTFPISEQGTLFDTGTLPQWPLKEWMEYLASIKRDDFRQAYKICLEKCQSTSTATDQTSTRMVKNYTLLMLAWRYVSHFAGIPIESWDVEESIIREMNTHIASTDADREPWVKIMDKLLIDLRSSRYPHKWTTDTIIDELGFDQPCLIIKLGDIMDYITNDLKEFSKNLPITSKRALKAQLQSKQVILDKVIHPYLPTQDGGNKRFHNFVAIPATKLLKYGLTIPEIDYDIDPRLNVIYENQ